MDVADELRRRRLAIEEHLEASDRDTLRAGLIDRYREMGHDADPRLLEEAIDTVRSQQHRFCPPRPGAGLTLATLYVRRAELARRVLTPLLALSLAGALVAGAAIGVRSWRADREANQQQQTAALADRAASLLAEVRAVALEPATVAMAEALSADAQRALAAGDDDRIEHATRQLAELVERLQQEYTLVITRGRERDGVRHYLIVQARGPDQQPVRVQIRDEETGDLDMVSEWGERVDKRIYDQVAADYADNQVIDDHVMGQKRRGLLEPEARFSSIGRITQW